MKIIKYYLVFKLKLWRVDVGFERFINDAVEYYCSKCMINDFDSDLKGFVSFINQIYDNYKIYYSFN